MDVTGHDPDLARAGRDDAGTIRADEFDARALQRALHPHHVDEIPETQAFGSPNARYLKQIADVCSRTGDAVLKALDAGQTPLILGGDHSIAAGSVSGVSDFYRRRDQKIGVIWIDAHSDINTPDTSPCGNVHGMPLAALLGLGLEPLSNLYGYSPKIAAGKHRAGRHSRRGRRRARQHPPRRHLRGLHHARHRRARHESRNGRGHRTAGRGTAGYHVSLDMDWIDPEDAPGVGTPVRGGATYREAHLAMEILADHGRLLSFEMVEVNPVIDEHNRTADLAVELACSAFGKKIL